MIIDATNLILGRLAAYASKQALLGNKVEIINCEKAIITGKRDSIFAFYRERIERGYIYKGPFMSRMPDRIIKRTIRGMLPYKKERGKIALKKIRCYLGMPKEFDGKKMETLKEAHLTKMKNISYITIGELANHLGK